jgi:glucose/arabinose dehydrogenase
MPRTSGRARAGFPRSSVRSILAALVLVSLLVVPAGPASAATSITWDRKVSGLPPLTQVTSAPDGSSRLFVVEQQGVVRVYRNGGLQAKPYLDIRGRVRYGGEGGLLSIAFDPRFRTHHFVYAAYTDNSGDMRVARFHAGSATALSVSSATYRKVITVSHPSQYTNHFAGQLVFGNSGNLYISTGDGGGGGDPFDHGQDPTTMQGKILRIQVIGAAATCGRGYCIPASNPFAHSTTKRRQIWALGLRNAWRFSVDRGTGDLWIADVGQDRREEIDHVTSAGRNLGWSCYEARLFYNSSRCRSGVTYTFPRWAYSHSYGEAVIGGFIYRGSRYAGLLGGSYIGGDEVSGKVFRGTPSGIHTVGSLPGVSSFGQTDGREIWAVTVNGGLYRMVAHHT